MNTFEKPRKSADPVLWVLGVVFLLPRVIRMWHPDVWLEDPFYLYAAAQINEGFLPFRDYGHTQLPGAEYALAFFYRIFGASMRVAEAVTQASVYATTWLVFFAGEKLRNRATGIGAAVVFSCSSLLFRYHVYEREIFILLLLAVIFHLFLKWDRLDWRRAVIAGGLLGLCVFFKMTAVVSVAASVLFVWAAKKDFSGAVKLAVSAGGWTVLVFGFSCSAAPEQFFNQCILYHFVKGDTFSSKLDMLVFPAYCLDITLALGVVGLPFWKRSLLPGMWFPVFLLLAEWIFFAFVSPNAWPHNYIMWLFCLSLRKR